MVRFYCTVCKKVKRVQNWPIGIKNHTSVNPIERIGECNCHSQTRTITNRDRPYASRFKFRRGGVKSVKAVTVNKTKKSK